MRIYVIGFVILINLLLSFVCNQSHAPIIENTLAESVQLEVTYSDGTTFSGQYPPGATIYAPTEGLTVKRVKMRMGSQPPIELKPEDLFRLRAQIGPGSDVRWRIQEDGVYPIRLGE